MYIDYNQEQRGVSENGYIRRL